MTITVERDFSITRLFQGKSFMLWAVHEAGKPTQYKTSKELATAYAAALRIARGKGKC